MHTSIRGAVEHCRDRAPDSDRFRVDGRRSRRERGTNAYPFPAKVASSTHATVVTVGPASMVGELHGALHVYSTSDGCTSRVMQLCNRKTKNRRRNRLHLLSTTDMRSCTACSAIALMSSRLPANHVFWAQGMLQASERLGLLCVCRSTND